MKSRHASIFDYPEKKLERYIFQWANLFHSPLLPLYLTLCIYYQFQMSRVYNGRTGQRGLHARQNIKCQKEIVERYRCLSILSIFKICRYLHHCLSNIWYLPNIIYVDPALHQCIKMGKSLKKHHTS